MNRKIVRVILPVLVLVELCFLFLAYQSYAYKEVDKVEDESVNKSIFAMYIENDSGEYEEVTDTEYFPSGYKINIEKSSCVDGKGNIIENLLVLKNDKITVTSNKTVFCYIYFDINNSVYQKVKSDYQNNNGAALLEETESDEYSVYYYTGDITNNNIMYGGFCWKMVRTTETGGVKLIYNGKPQTTDDGISCNNTGEDATIGTSAFNSQNNSLAYVGYMYNNIYSSNTKNMLQASNVYNTQYSTGTYYFSDDIVWNGTNYTLINKDGSEVVTYNWADNYNELKEMYTCLSSSSINCNSAAYTISGNAHMSYIKLSDGNDYDDYIVKLATSVTNNEDGTYTLVNPIEVTKVDYRINYSNYKNYYYCDDLVSETCSDMHYSTSTSSSQLTGNNIAYIYKYGNSFKYENEKYTLLDTKEFWNWSENYSTINNNHYTCFDTTGECEQVRYIYQTNSSTAYYIILSDGKSVEDAINEMLYAEDVNKTNSTIKEKVDGWYEESILDKKDENNNLYSSYLENTIWCNNREIRDLGGWNPNGETITAALFFNPLVLNCSNQTDQFTLKVEAGGIEGYGNNALDYPVGLITYKEVRLVSEYSYIALESHSYLLSPSIFINTYAGGSRFRYGQLYGSNAAYNSRVSDKYLVRPSISLNLNVDITNGDGTYTNPYQIELNNE